MELNNKSYILLGVSFFSIYFIFMALFKAENSLVYQIIISGIAGVFSFWLSYRTRNILDRTKILISVGFVLVSLPLILLSSCKTDSKEKLESTKEILDTSNNSILGYWVTHSSDGETLSFKIEKDSNFILTATTESESASYQFKYDYRKDTLFLIDEGFTSEKFKVIEVTAERLVVGQDGEKIELFKR